ncbi:MAG TPA: hypothetical protein VH351_11035 [Bryobacteraceae bacterium]|jgi:hypothetical protein|nr:hypothetical protein [Bryobacteraceae bacterium]
MMKLLLITGFLVQACAFAQAANYGISAPIVVSGAAELAHNTGGVDNSTQGRAGVRATVAPSLLLGAHWFAYSLVDIRSSDYLPYEEHGDEAAIDTRLSQAYIGYKQDFAHASLLVKAGRLASAFGSYPLQYNDAKTAFINPPLPYYQPLPFRPDQRACDLDDLLGQDYGGSVAFHCGGSSTPGYGRLPVTLYGIPGIETQISWKRVDSRAQITNSSPANPQSLLSASQAIQWTTGGGYSFRGGLRAGFSQFHGPYLDSSVTPALPPNKRFRDYRASGFGIDSQWSHAAWAAEGEWQFFHFDLPGFIQSPSQQAAYIQIKRILSPRYYAAFRSSIERPGGARDGFGERIAQFQDSRQTHEFVFGYWINHLQLLKMGFQYSGWNAWSYEDDVEPARHELGIQLQLVTSFNGLSKSY